MKQSTFSAVMANNLLTVLHGYSKTIRLLLVMLLTLTVSANAWGEDFEKYSGTITEGDYLIVYSNGAMKNTVSGDRLQYTDVTVSNNKISNPDASLIWHIASSGNYWTIYNANVEKYAAGTGAKNKAQLLESGTDNKSLWTVSGTSTYEFVNKANEAASVNSNLRKNGTYGFACYGTGTGGALTLYKKVTAASSHTVTATSNNINYGTVSVSGTTITATPNDGYRVKSGDAGYTVTSGTADVTNNGDNTFSVTPSSDCTITINFEAIPQYTVTWDVNGDQSVTTQVTEGSKPTFPATPSSCDATSTTFYGWATATWDGKIDDINGKTIYTSANDMPAVNGAVTYYAVFATKGAGGGAAFDGTSGGDFKIYALVEGEKKYLKGTGSKISPVDEAQATEYTFTKISDGVFSIKTGTTYLTYASSTDLGTSTDPYSWKISEGTKGSWRIASTNTTTRGLVYRAGTTNKFGGYALSNITANGTEYYDVEIGGASVSYSGYITTCAAGDPCDALQAPNVTATATANSITLSWDAVDGATSYNVYNYTTEEAEEVNVLTYTFNGLDPETEYEWGVESAKGECFKETRGTTTTSATPCEKLGAATGLTVETNYVHTDGKTYVKFSWTPADNTKANATSQQICFGKVDEAGTCVDDLAKDLTWTGDLASKLSAGEYWWSIQALGDGVNYCDGDVVNGTNFYIYSITYNTNGGNTIEATSGTTLPDPLPIPTREHYNFEGWYTDQGLTQEATAGAQITQNTTLYAKWTANTYIITLDANGGTFVDKRDSQTKGSATFDYIYGTYATYNDAPNLTEYYSDLKRDGYQFDKWVSGGSPWNKLFTSTGDRTIQAQWSKLHTVTFNTGTNNPTVDAMEGTSETGITLPAGPTPACSTDGWEFAGWWTESVAETTTSPGELLTAGSNYKPTEDCTLYAVYSKEETEEGGGTTPIEATLSFANKAQRTSFSSTQQVWEQNGITLTNNKHDSSSDVADYANPARFYAGSQIIINAPKVITEIVATCIEDKHTTALVNSVGKDASSNNNVVTIIPAASSTTYTIAKLTAQVQMSSLTVTYLAESGPTTTTTYNSNPSCEVCENILTISKGEETNGNTFTLSQSGDIETCDEVVEVVVTPKPAEHYSVSEVTATTPTSGGAPTVTDKGDGTWTVTYAQDSNGESTISVIFEEDAKASITLSELGVETTDNTTYYVGETYTLPSTSSQSCEGKQLVGWSTVEVPETDTKPTENYYELGAEVTLEATQTFYAVFATAGEGGVDNTDYSNVHTSNVALDKTGGTNATNSQVNIGGMDYTAVKAGTGSAMGAVNITVPSGTTKLSFHMAGWNGEGNKTISLSGATADPSSFKTVADAGVSGNTTTYTLSGTIANYFYSTTLSNIDAETTLTFSNGGADQRFVIWGVNASTGGGVSYSAYTTSCVPTYSITYDFAGGTGSHCSNTSVPQGDSYTICDEAPTKEGHTFLGWSDGTDTYAAGETITPTGNVTLTAVWQINTYTVIWSNNGATTPVTYEHGDDLTLPSEPASCDGVKEFVGWTEDNTFTYHATTPPSDLFTEKTATVTADKTYYAVFATKGEGSANFVLGESGTFKIYANVNGINYYAQGGVSSSKITSTTEAANASDYTLTHKGNNQYTIQLGNAYIGHSGFSSTDLNTTETTWTIKEGVNGSWRIVSPVNTSRALAYRASTYKIFKAYSMTSVEAGDTEYYDIEFGGTSSGYSDYTTTCQQIESIEVQNPKTEFYLTDDFTIGEGKVMATLSGGGTTDVTALATFSGYNMNVVGTYTVTVTYMGATATYDINVKPLDNAWVLTWNVSGKTNTGLGPRTVTKGSAIGTLPIPEVPAACEGKTFMGWTESNIVPSDGKGIVYITEETKPTDNTTYYAVFATVNNFCTQKPIDQISSGSKVVIVAVASLTADGGSGKAISSRATDDTYNLQGDDVAIYDQTINTPHSTCIWTISKSGEKYIFIQDGKYLNGVLDGMYSNLKYLNTEDSWTLHPAQSGMTMTYNMESTNASGEYIEWYRGKFAIHNEVNKNGDFDMQFYVTLGDGEDITDYTTGCEEYTITYYGFRGGYSTSSSSDGIIVLPVNSAHTVPDCGDVVKDHTDLGREFLNLWMTEPHGGHTFKPGDTFILTQDTTLYAQWKLNTTTDVTLPTGVEDLAGTDVYVYGGNTLTMVPDIVTINSLTLKGGLQPDGSYQMPNVWIPDGATLVRNTNKINLDLVVNAKNYYPFAVPFAAKNNQYVEYIDPTLAAASTYGTHFAIKTYDGARRAEEGEDRANNWVRVLRDETLQPGVGYIISAMTYPEKDTATIRIPMTVPNTWFENGEQTVVGTTTRNAVALTAHTGAATTEHQRHAGWNFVASPYLSNFSGNNIGGEQGYINGWINISKNFEYEDTTIPYVTIPVADFSYYNQIKVAEATLSPEWSFFVQIGKGGTMNFATEGRKQAPASVAARSTEERPVKMEVDITLTNGSESDQTGLIICDLYSDAYEIGRDLEKMFGSAYNLVVYSLMPDKTPLAYQALAIHHDMQMIPIGYRAPAEGKYTFSLNATSSIDLLKEQYEQLVLVDYQTGELTNLLDMNYTFDSERTQSDSRFAIYPVLRKDTQTSLPNILDGDTSTYKVFHDGHLYIIHEGRVYNGNGQIVK